VIGKEYLIYDNVTHSYPVNLPVDYYQRFIMDNLPKSESGSGKWFIRPHHLESLTNHQNSIKDDVKNTRYFSHLNQDFDKKVEVNQSQEAIVRIEDHLSKLKAQMETMAFKRGYDLSELEDMREKMKMQAMNEYEAFINDKTRFQSKDLIIQAYESVLTDQRKTEKTILNRQRNQEFEKNRPPQDNWYELKTSGFQKELYRNRVALKPNNLNAVYLENLQDQNLY
jgi:hypothetical protein